MVNIIKSTAIAGQNYMYLSNFRLTETMALLVSEVTTTLEHTLSLKGLVVHSVPSDGHCLLHAIREVLCCDHHIDISMEELKATIQAELCQNFEQYNNFLTDGKLQIFDTDGKMVDSEFNPSAARDKFTKELMTYFKSGSYNSDAADIIIAALCNAFSLTLVIYISAIVMALAYLRYVIHLRAHMHISLCICYDRAH